MFMMGDHIYSLTDNKNLFIFIHILSAYYIKVCISLAETIVPRRRNTNLVIAL